MNRQFRRWAALLLALALAAGLAGCGREEVREQYTKTALGPFDTLTVIKGYDVSEEAFSEKAQALLDLLEEYHRLYDIYHTYEGMANLKTVNDRAGIAPVEVDGAILDLLEYGVEAYALTGGKTNIAMGSVLTLWHDRREEAERDPAGASLPEPADLREAALHTDITGVEIDREAGTVFLSDPEMRLDVGAVAKGYAVDRLAQYAMEQGWTDLLLSVGGNVRTVGGKGDGTDWKAGIQAPEGWDRAYFCLVPLRDLSLVTSGSYQRYYTVDGVRYHHLIDPDTLFPRNTFLSVSVICENSARGDALSTALFNMEAEEGLALVEGLEGTEAVWVYPDGSYFYSSGLEGKLTE